MSGKIPVPELLRMMLSNDQIAILYKVPYRRNVLGHKIAYLYINDNSIGLGLAEMTIPKLLENNK